MIRWALGLVLIGRLYGICTPLQPIVLTTPSTTSSPVSMTVNITVQIQNADQGFPCGAEDYTLTPTLPPGWGSGFSPTSPITGVVQAATATTTWSLSIPADAPLGATTVPITVQGSGSGATVTGVIITVTASGGGGGGGGTGTAQLTGVVNNPDGTGANGTLLLSLSQQAAMSTAGSCGGPIEVVPTYQVRVKVVNGVMQSAPSVYANDCMLPQGLYYNVKLVDNNGNTIFTDRWVITGPTQDIGTIVSVVISGTTGTLGNAGVILLKPTSTQTIAQPGTTFLEPNRLKVTDTFQVDDQVLCNSSGCQFGAGAAFNGGLVTPPGTNSAITIGAGGNFYQRTFSGGDAGCAGIQDGWTGYRTDAGGVGCIQQQVCFNNLLKKVNICP